MLRFTYVVCSAPDEWGDGDEYLCYGEARRAAEECDGCIVEVEWEFADSELVLDLRNLDSEDLDVETTGDDDTEEVSADELPADGWRNPGARFLGKKYGIPMTDAEKLREEDVPAIEQWRDANGLPHPQSPLVHGVVQEKLRARAEDEARCSHGMFTTGAGACPMCTVLGSASEDAPAGTEQRDPGVVLSDKRPVRDEPRAAVMLDLSTAHVPAKVRESLGFDPTTIGGQRVQPHEHGFIVYISSEYPPPDHHWLFPIWQRAIAVDALLVNFDTDGDIDEDLRAFEEG